MSALIVMLALTSADCAGCHPQQAALVVQSRHAEAAQLPVFVVSARRAGTTWCASCHRPASRGLDCLTCHPRHHDETATATVACATCHEFNTPLPDHLAPPVMYSTQPLQATASELARTDRAARCVDCHDPHRPVGGHDVAMVRRAVAITARRDGNGIAIRVAASRIGHRFPTGDPFRRLVVAVYDDDGELVDKQTIGRGFALVDGVWAPVLDHTLGDGEWREFRFVRGRRWTAVYAYGDPRFEAELPASEVSVEVASGTL